MRRRVAVLALATGSLTVALFVLLSARDKDSQDRHTESALLAGGPAPPRLPPPSGNPSTRVSDDTPQSVAAPTARDFFDSYPNGSAYLEELARQGINVSEHPMLEPFEAVFPELSERALRSEEQIQEFADDIVDWPEGSSVDELAAAMNLNLRGKAISLTELEDAAFAPNLALRDAAVAEARACNVALSSAISMGDYLAAPLIYLPEDVTQYRTSKSSKVFFSKSSALRGWKMTVDLDTDRYAFFQEASSERVQASFNRHAALQSFIDELDG